MTRCGSSSRRSARRRRTRSAFRTRCSCWPTRCWSSTTVCAACRWSPTPSSTSFPPCRRLRRSPRKNRRDGGDPQPPAARARRSTACSSGTGGCAQQHHPGGIRGHGPRRQGIHRRRRHLPVRAQPALRDRLRPARGRPLPRAAAGESLALHVHSGTGRISRSSAVRRKSTCAIHGRIDIRPIAGTRWRGQTPEEDDALAADLLADPKERAEHLMLVDLARNDVGRIAKHGSVKVDDFMIVERYSHVMHIVSNVSGELDPSHSAYDVLRATFPAGTVSGAPKIRAMQIINSLEKHKRCAYAGAVGYFRLRWLARLLHHPAHLPAQGRQSLRPGRRRRRRRFRSHLRIHRNRQQGQRHAPRHRPGESSSPAKTLAAAFSSSRFRFKGPASSRSPSRSPSLLVIP
jgi:hypothetical protein